MNNLNPKTTNFSCIFLLTFVLLISKQDLTAQNNAGQLTGGATICAANNNGVLSLTGYNGSILRWETASSPNGPWSAMIYTQGVYQYTNINQSLWFRVVTKDANFQDVYSNVEALICQQPGITPIINGPSQLCSGFNGTANLISGSSLNPVWQYSQDNWQTQITLTASSTSSVGLNNISPPYQLRFLSQDGMCPLLFSNTLTILAAQASQSGSISGISSACSNSNAFTLTVAGQNGNLNFWEIAGSPAGPYSSINGSAGLTSLSQANLLQTAYYRVNVQNTGCNAASSAIHSVQVQTPSTGGFIAGTAVMCSGANSGSLLLLGSTGSTLQWQFSTNGGVNWNTAPGTSTILNLSNISSTRIYRAQVQNGSCPLSTSSSHTLSIENPPVVSFTFSSACLGVVCNFSNMTQNASAHFWQFGDGMGSALTSPAHTYNAAGTYSVKLKSFSAFGCKDSVTAQVIIHPLPTPAFISNSATCEGTGLQVISTATISSGNIVIQSFDFNEGAAPASTALTTHSFSSPGTKLITLLCTSNFGCSQSVTKNVLIHPKPLADFHANNSCAETNLILSDASQISSGSISRNWSFGNGDSSLLTNPVYSYQQAGTYFIKLTVTSDKACLHSIIKPVIIHPLLTATLTATNACAGRPASLSVLYNSTLTPGYSQLIFGDGSSSNVWKSQHVYHQPGFYSVKYLVQTDSGCVSESSSSVVIHPQPQAIFTVPSACQSERLKINHQSIISTGTFFPAWSLDNLQSTADEPDFFVSTAGLHTIELVVVSNYGCGDTTRKSIKINPRPQLSFSISGNCQFESLFFQNNSIVSEGRITSVGWNFGDLSSSTIWQTQKKYEAAGIYSITLSCISNENCSALETKTLEVFPRAKAGFEKDLFCEGQSARLINTTQLPGGNFSSFWSLDNKEITKTNDYDIEQLPAGRHLIKLLTETNAYCRDSVEENIFIYPAPELRIKADTLINLGQEIELQANGASTYSWFPENNLRTAANGLAYCRPDSSLFYTCFGQSENGCISEKKIHITVRKNYDLTIYNLLSPDGNGLNDTWEIENIQAYPDNKVMIFDQWNNLVLETTNYQNSWDGKNIRGELLPPGTYFYQISFASSPKVFRGYLSLLLTR